MRFFSSILRKWLAPVVGACLVPTLGFAQASKPQYTSLQDCRTVNRLKLPNRVVDAGVFRCKGAGGYAVYVVEDDPRSFLVLERGKKLFSLEKPMVETFTLGNFPNVSGTAKAEWRVDASGKAVALIVRVAYRKPDNGKAASTLLVFDLRGEAPALVGSAATNEDARSLADAAPAQGDEEALSRACNAIYAELCKDLPAGPERLGRCYDKRPAIADKVPAKCVADFQTNIENYHQAVGGAQ